MLTVSCLGSDGADIPRSALMLACDTEPLSVGKGLRTEPSPVKHCLSSV